MSQKIFCPSKRVNENWEIISPIVGVGKFLVGVNDPIYPEQVFAEIFQLNKKFILLLPKNLCGHVISLAKNNSLASFSYGETILTIKEELKEKGLPKIDQRKISGEDEFIVSPMDGMFYLAPTPSEPPFVNIGQTIKPGQTIGLIEVMKSFYPVKFQGRSPAKLVGVNVEDATPIHSGDKIYAIEVKK